MKKWSRRKRWLVGIASSLAFVLLFAAVGVYAIGYVNLFRAHEHCSKGLGLALRQYAADHAGQYPHHTNGFGDALLELVKSGALPDVHWITAPGDDGRMFRECLTNNLDVPEAKCTRIYVQGLSEANIGDRVAIAFDKYPTPGGDHFRRPWGRPQRDVVMSDGTVEFIYEVAWPRFAREQIEQLVKLGLSRSELEALFGMQSQSNP